MAWIKFWLIIFILFSAATQFCAAQKNRITLEQAIDMALQKNPALLGAEHDLKAASWEVKRSYFNLLPNVDVEVGYSRLDNATVRRANVFYDVGREYFADLPGVDPDDIRPNAWLNSFGTRINVVQPIYNGGANWAGVRMSLAAKNQQKHSD